MGKVNIHDPIKLKNGLKIIYIYAPDIKSVGISLRGLAGANHEMDDEIGIAHLLEHLVFNGTEKFNNPGEVDDYIEAVGGKSNAYTGHEYVNYQVKLLEEDIERGFVYLSEIALYPLLRPEDIAKEISVIEQEINRMKDSPEYYVPRALPKLLYPNHRMKEIVTGDIEHINKINQEKIKKFRERTYVAENFALAVCTSKDKQTVIDLAEKYFGHMKSGKKQKTSQPDISNKLDIKIENKENLQQAVLAIGFNGFPYNSEQVTAQKLIAQILGDGTLSRLYTSLREKHGLCYVASAYNLIGSNYGNLNIYVGLAEKNIPKALELIKEELNKISTEEVPEKELDRVKNSLVASFIFDFEDSLDTAEYYTHHALLNETSKNHLEEVEKYKAVTSAEIKKVAKEMFSKNPKILIVSSKLDKDKVTW